MLLFRSHGTRPRHHRGFSRSHALRVCILDWFAHVISGGVTTLIVLHPVCQEASAPSIVLPDAPPSISSRLALGRPLSTGSVMVAATLNAAWGSLMVHIL